jgi:hypothetical protein
LWWLLAAIVVTALAIGIPLLVRSRRRAAWQRGVSAAEAELVWFARELLPELRESGSPERAAGAWAVSAPRVTAAEDQLTALASDAPDEAAAGRAATLRDATRTARQRVDEIVRAGAPASMSGDLDDVQLELERVLPPAAPPDPASPPA